MHRWSVLKASKDVQCRYRSCCCLFLFQFSCVCNALCFWAAVLQDPLFRLLLLFCSFLFFVFHAFPRLRRPVGISCGVVVFVCVPVAPGGALGAPDVGGLRRPVGFLVAVGLLLFVCPGLVGAFGVLWPGCCVAALLPSGGAFGALRWGTPWASRGFSCLVVSLSLFFNFCLQCEFCTSGCT